MKRLYRSRRDRVIAGVCGGVGEYLSVDPVVVRIVWVLLALLGGSGILAYIVGIILIPENPEEEGNEHSAPKKMSRTTSQTIWGVVLIGIGLLILLSKLHVFHFFSPHFWEISWGIIFPVFLIIVGVIVLTRYNKRQGNRRTVTEDEKADTDSARGSSIVRPRDDRILAGVCSGIGYYIKLDPTIVRLLWVIGTFATGGVALIIYIILAIVFPEGDVSPGKEDQETEAA